MNAGEKPAPKDRIEKAYSLEGLNITGDLAVLFTRRTVRDRYAFFPAEELSHDLLLGALQEEAAIKDAQKGGRAIGF